MIDLLNQLQAQSGKHLHASCTIDGQTFNPAAMLIKTHRRFSQPYNCNQR